MKENNPLFSNILISVSRLAELPDNIVPNELQVITKVSTDIKRVDAKHDGYVPAQEICDDESDGGEF